MSGVLKIDIKESKEELKKLMSSQKTGQTKERLQVLYWFKSTQSRSIEELADASEHSEIPEVTQVDELETFVG
ncbi:hypothetical protein [Tolypothrix bouteillei]|uniref:hypothetical protein n=1 Tax=Tolypothrix bouteillei TaxID=1246981 RepID=UPI0005133F68